MKKSVMVLAVLALVGCGKSEVKTAELKPVEPVESVSQQPVVAQANTGTSTYERAALAGNYQAQRNYAYEFRERGKPVDECIWRIVIMQSGHKDMSAGDESNFKFACGKLSQAQQQEAVAWAQKTIDAIEQIKAKKK